MTNKNYIPEGESLDHSPSKYLKLRYLAPKTHYRNFKRKGLTETFVFDNPEVFYKGIENLVTNGLGYNSSEPTKEVKTISRKALGTYLKKMNERVKENKEEFEDLKEYSLIYTINEDVKEFRSISSKLKKIENLLKDENKSLNELDNSLTKEIEQPPFLEKPTKESLIKKWILKFGLFN